MPYWKFLLLNVVVSAVTVLTVLAIWGQGRKPAEVLPTATIDILAQVASVIPTATETPTPTLEPEIYIVQTGDTLFGIALDLGVPMEDLMAENNISDAAAIDVGQELIVPQVEGRIRATATGTAAPATQETADPSDPDSGPHDVSIERIDATGDIESEQIFFVNSGGVAAMVGWTIDDGDGHVYIFPNFTLHNGGGVMLHIGSGTNMVADLYWGLHEAILDTGKTITLRDASGNIQSSWVIR